MLLPLLLSAASCGSDKPSSPSERRATIEAEYRELVKGYNKRTGAQQIGVGDVLGRLAQGEQFVFLDIREAREQKVSTLPQAIRLHPDDVEQARLSLPSQATVVTYCTAGYRSGMAAVVLTRRLGRTVYNLDGGIIEWFNHGGPVVGPDAKPAMKIDPYSKEWARFVRTHKH